MNISPDDIAATPYGQGVDHYESYCRPGVTEIDESDNPYPEGSVEFGEWLAGFRYADAREGGEPA